MNCRCFKHALKHLALFSFYCLTSTQPSLAQRGLQGWFSSASENHRRCQPFPGVGGPSSAVQPRRNSVCSANGSLEKPVSGVRRTLNSLRPRRGLTALMVERAASKQLCLWMTVYPDPSPPQCNNPPLTLDTLGMVFKPIHAHLQPCCHL